MKEKHLFNLYANYSISKIERHDYFHTPNNCSTCHQSFRDEAEFLKYHEGLGYTFYEYTPYGYYLFTKISEQELDELQKKFSQEIEEARRQKEEMKKKTLENLRKEIEEYKTRQKFFCKIYGNTEYGYLKIWFNNQVVDKLLYIDENELKIKVRDFPWEGVKIVKTQKGTLVCVPDPDYRVVHIEAGHKSGKRREVFVINNLETFKYPYFHSPRAALGAEYNALVNVPKNIRTIRIKINENKYAYREYVYDIETGERSEVPPEEVL